MSSKNSINYMVVCNHEGQYSIWPSNKNIPYGWKFKGFEGEKEDCLNYIANIWADLRPLSLKNKMETMKL